MMTIGDHIEIPPWDYHFIEDLTPPVARNVDDRAFAALQRFLPSNIEQEEDGGDSDDFDFPVDAFSCDHFRMFEFKVKKCARARSHDWTECPFAHPGEKARRRDPRKYHYAGSACPDFRKGVCKRGDACEHAHGVFECWLHPARYRTQPCKDGTHCRRRVCFFAHTPDQLRVLPYSCPEGSPGGHPGYGSFLDMGSLGSYSPPSPNTASPPLSPSLSSLSQLSDSVRCLQLNNMGMSMGMGMGMSPPSWGLPRSPSTLGARYRAPIRSPIRQGPSTLDIWKEEEEPVMERVESGRQLRERIYAKLSKENSLERVDRTSGIPDVGWVSELVK